MVRFGLWYDFRNPARWQRPIQDGYAETFEQIRWAERLGFDDVALSEHHFVEDGYASAMMPIAAAIAAQTSRIRIGTSVLLLPLHSPVRLAEDASTVDIISGGRLDLGVALGYHVVEFRSLGIDFKSRGRRMDEALTVLTGCLRNEEYSFRGEFYEVDRVRVTPRAIQDPLPVWVGALAPPAVRRAARLGDGLIGGAGPDMAPLFLEEWAACGRQGTPPIAAPAGFSFVAGDPDEGWQRIKDHLLYQRRMYAEWLAESGFPLFGKPPQSAEEIRAGQPDIVVTPERAVELLAETLRAQPAITNLYWAPVLPGMRPADAAPSIELVAREVLPNLRA
jgi:alkanesulfonate monooxygenase SsuD/methylene tetrahydromethanopterin reductase-like flavin-dependent oxidoreductase (luciferase family)